MFIIAQIPFVDFRLLSSEVYEGSFFPNTFDRNFERALYYRFLGEEKNRFSPNGLPMSERRYFDSKKILYLRDYKFKGDACYFPQLLFARFFEDTHCFHFDIGLRETLKNSINRHNLNVFAKDLLGSPFFGINRRYEQKDKLYNLIELIKKIKEIYLYATASKKYEIHKEYSRKIVMGYPALFIIYDKREFHSFGMAQEVQLSNGIKVRHELVSSSNIFADVWYVGKDELSKYNQELRNLRIYLSKLHSYKESTRIILDYLDKDRDENLNYHKVGTFFNYMLNQMNRKQYYGYDNDDFWKIAFYVDNKYNHVSWDEFRGRIEAKLKEIEMSAGNQFGDVQIISGNEIHNSPIVGASSTNATINVSVGSQDKLREFIQEFDRLADELKSSNSQLAEEQKIILNDQAEVFKEYVTSESPNKKIANKLLLNLQRAISFGVLNSDGIQRLYEMGLNIVNLLK